MLSMEETWHAVKDVGSKGQLTWIQTLAQTIIRKEALSQSLNLSSSELSHFERAVNKP